MKRASPVREKNEIAGDSTMHFWRIIIFLTLVIKSLGEDNITCFDIYKQPAFEHELLRNHKIQEQPSEIPKPIETKKNNKWQTWEAHMKTWDCPQGMVPIRSDDVTSSTPTVVESYQHEYAVVTTGKTQPKMYGARATISVWDPTVEIGEELSLAQIWITSGSYKTNDLNTIEVGWQVLPNMYQDTKPRLFIYWTSDTYNVTGCYNLQCPGFIQTSNNIVIGGTISPVSAFEGNQFEIPVSVWKDQKHGNWWLSLGSNHSLVGYWPAELFPNLASAKEVQWGGEIVNSQNSGRHTTTQMGSGHFPDEGFGKVSYIRNLEIFDNNNFQPVQDVQPKATAPKFYNIEDMSSDDWGTYFFFGGPGFTRVHSGVSSLRLTSFLFYFSVIIFFII